MKSYEAHIAADSDYYIYNPSTLAQTLFFYPLVLGHFIYEPGYFLHRNNYDSFLLMLITDGQCTVTTANGTFTASKGDVVLLNCYEPHQYQSDTGWESYWIHFDGPMARGYYDQITAVHGLHLIPKHLQTIEQTIAKIYKIFCDHEEIEEATISKYITCLLTELLLSATPAKESPHKMRSLADTISYINEHFSEQLSLEQLAEQASLSPFYFTRVFTKETGMTPHQYILSARINFAKFLLKTTNMSVKKIGYNAGFTSESNFCSTFRKWENLTPSEYRDVAKN